MSFISDVPNSKLEVILQGQGEKFVLVSLKTCLDHLVMTDHEGGEDLFTILAPGIMVLRVATIAACSLDLSNN